MANHPEIEKHETYPDNSRSIEYFSFLSRVSSITQPSLYLASSGFHFDLGVQSRVYAARSGRPYRVSHDGHLYGICRKVGIRSNGGCAPGFNAVATYKTRETTLPRRGDSYVERDPNSSGIMTEVE